ncbi:MAG: mechanosensitive ion channel [Spirochaetia bacterium]
MGELISEIAGFSFYIGKIKIVPVDMLLKIVLPLLGVLLLIRLIRLFSIKIIIKRLRLREKTVAKINRTLKIILRIITLLSAFFIIGIYFNFQVPQYVYDVLEIFQKPFFVSGSTQISIITLILLIPIFYLAHIISKYLKNLMDTKLLKKLAIDKSAKFGVSRLSRYLVFIFSVLIGLSFIGIDLSALAVLIGVLGIGIGFGLQNLVANFFAGIVIIVERPLQEGDRVIVGGIEGDILKIRLRSTVINTLTNETLIVPNSNLVDQHIHNYSYKFPEIVIINRIQVSYATDLERARNTLFAVAEDNPFRLPSKPVRVYIREFQDSGIQIELWTWISNAIDKIEATSWTNLQIWKSFKEQNITIPFPQLDLHIKKDKK